MFGYRFLKTTRIEELPEELADAFIDQFEQLDAVQRSQQEAEQRKLPSPGRWLRYRRPNL